MSSKSDVLKRYLNVDNLQRAGVRVGGSADSTIKKKKKKTKDSSSLSTRIIDESEDFSWSASSSLGRKKNKYYKEDDDEETPVVVDTADSALKFTGESWSVIREGELNNNTKNNNNSSKDKEGDGWTAVIEGQEISGDLNDTDSHQISDLKRAMEDQGFKVELDENIDEKEIIAHPESRSKKYSRQTSSNAPHVSRNLRRASPSSSPPPQEEPSRYRKSNSLSPPPRRRRRTPSPSPSPSESPKFSHDHRKRRRSPSPSPEPESSKESKKTQQKLMEDGTTTGLTSAAQVRETLERKRQDEMKRLSLMNPTESGKNAATVYRNKHGRIVDLEEESERESAKAALKAAEEAERLKYKEGVAQKRERLLLQQRLEKEKKSAFAVSRDDDEFNASLKEVDRWGDPMAGLGGGSGSKKEGGKSTKPRYKGPNPPPNRFRIPPGYRWDGVDRGNGFENKLFQSKYAQVSLAQEAYRWSTEDM